MRFIENGPSIPDELLNARDEGRVVFFCGSGVSAQAELPDFFGLASDVISRLGVPKDNDACKVLITARKIAYEQSVTGLISADRVFSFLERDFTPEVIQVVVAKSLKPKVDSDLSSHQLLLRLAKTPSSKIQLVTTNFDRLFEKCNSNLTTYQPPRLPNPARKDVLDGVIYLHGRVNDTYTGSDGDGFVLSSSDFGHAYLSDGWATEFFRKIVREYVVAFIGYSADDPPIHYLLEGLNRTQDSSRQIYAFQVEDSDESVARWRYKGVKAIPYTKEGGHSALWETLEHWARRADDPTLWHHTIIDLAMNGPEGLQSHQRGQVAHIVSTYEGARRFYERTPPAEWLSVFDPSCRYESPGKSHWFDSNSPIVDPFSLFGLDADATPESNTTDENSRTREKPSGAWDAFTANSLDRQNLSDEYFPAVRGHFAIHMPRLPKRLEYLGMWIAKVANQPAAVWWAARIESLNPGICQRIKWGLEHSNDVISPIILKAWQYLLEAREHIDANFERAWYDLKSEINQKGWTPTSIRAFTAVTCPYLKASPALRSSPVPPKKDADIHLSDLVRLEVECPVPHDTEIPDEWLEHVIRGLRKNIELAVQLYIEIGDMFRFHISPIEPEDRPDISDFGRTHGLSGYVIHFASLFKRLIKLDVSKARQEFLAWPTDDDTAFSRLRFWAGGNPHLVTQEEFFQIVNRLSNNTFWDHYHQRDLLLVLANRWETMADISRKHIEDRLLLGPAMWEGEDDTSYKERKAWATLGRLQWLSDNKCKFSFDLKEEIAKRRILVPKWKAEYAQHAADSMEMRGGMIGTNTEHEMLLQEPIDTIVSKAQELSGRSEHNFLEERDPFAGLCTERPNRAYIALTRAARRNEYPEWAWRTFFVSAGREKDKHELMAIIAKRLCRMPDEVLIGLLNPSTSWLHKVSKPLSKQYPKSFDEAISRLIDILNVVPSKNRSTTSDMNRGRDWGTEALNSPVGHIALAILEDSRLESIQGNIDPSANWLNQLTRLLTLRGDHHRHAITIISHHLGWFHHLLSDWTDYYLLSIIDAEDVEDREALWAGFLWDPKIGSANLFMRLKPSLLTLAKERDTSREWYLKSLVYLIVSGWITPGTHEGELCVSNSELREALLHGGDDFRSHILWQIEQELKGKEEDSRKEWFARSLEFFDDVWPQQRVVKNPIMSIRLCEFLLSNCEIFSKLVDAILPHLTKITQGAGFHLYFHEEAKDIINKHPERLLKLLYTVLSDEVSEWPYDIAEVLEQIGAADRNLLSDKRLQELMRKWNAR